MSVSTPSAVSSAFVEGRRAWPAISLTLDEFTAHVQRVEATDEILSARAADLFIAAACSNGDGQAIRRFEAQYLTVLDSVGARLQLPAELVAEARQQVRIAIMVGGEEEPLISRYRGTGPLKAWVRVIAARTALNLARTTRLAHGRSDVEALEALISPALGPEAAATKERYREKLEGALREALSSLEDRERTLLRLHFLDGLSIDAIGRIYRVHRATAARWLVTLRTRMLERVRQALPLPAAPTSSELRSLMRLLEGEIDLSLKRLLG